MIKKNIEENWSNKFTYITTDPNDNIIYSHGVECDKYFLIGVEDPRYFTECDTIIVFESPDLSKNNTMSKNLIKYPKYFYGFLYSYDNDNHCIDRYILSGSKILRHSRIVENMPNGVVINYCVDASHEIFVSCDNKIYKYNHTGILIRRLNLNNTILKICENNNNIYVLTRDDTILICNTRLNIISKKKTPITVHSIEFDNNNNLYCCNQAAIYKLDNQFEITKIFIHYKQIHDFCFNSRNDMIVKGIDNITIYCTD